jgi:hypothetical protein
VSLFWKIVDTLEPDPAHAQIVIGLASGRERDRRLGQLEPWLSGELTGCLRPEEETEAVLVIATGPHTCSETVTRLSELGIKQLHAIHPRRSGGKDSTGPKGTASLEGV